MIEVDRGLARGIGGVVGEGHPRGGRGDVDDASAAGLLHRPPRRRGQHGKCGDVDREGPLPGLAGHVEEGLDHAVAGVVDEHVDAAPAAEHCGDRRFRRAVAGEVAGDVEHARIVRRRGLLEAGGIEVGEPDPEAAREKLAGDVAAHAAAGAGDQRGAFFGGVGHMSLGFYLMRASFAVPVNSSRQEVSQSEGKASGR